MEEAKRIKLTDEPTSSGNILIKIENNLSNELNSLKFSSPVEYIYNPLVYAADVHQSFLKSFMVNEVQKVMFLGMNPGPWGMVQNGIPFGEWSTVKDWFKIDTGEISQPSKTHPAKPVQGFSCKRSEVSGKRFWDLFKKLCVQPEQFFKQCFVYNLCPLAFVGSTGKNITPTELKVDERKKLVEICEKALYEVIKELQVEVIVSIGKFAEKHALNVTKKHSLPEAKVVCIPHPSPRNPRTKNWVETTEELLNQLNLTQYLTPNESN